jgi:hypothetical protein
MGGGYRTMTAEDYYTGEKWKWASPRETLEGVGFRGVLRPTERFKDLAPKDRPR